MNPASTIEFRENRAKFTLEDLQKYADQWVAFSSDGQRIVASGDSFLGVFNQLRDAKQDMHSVAFEHIVIDSNEVFLGGAEFL